MSAAYRNQKEIVKLLIRHGVNPLIKSKYNITALDIACDVGADCQIVCLLEKSMEKYQP
jgi:ankyrin repeat protein